MSDVLVLTRGVRISGGKPSVVDDGIITRALLESCDVVSRDDMPTATEGRAYLRAGYEHELTPLVRKAADFAIANRVGRIVQIADPPPPRKSETTVVPGIGTLLRDIAALQDQVAEIRASQAAQLEMVEGLIKSMRPKKKETS